MHDGKSRIPHTLSGSLAGSDGSTLGRLAATPDDLCRARFREGMKILSVRGRCVEGKSSILPIMIMLCAKSGIFRVAALIPPSKSIGMGRIGCGYARIRYQWQDKSTIHLTRRTGWQTHRGQDLCDDVDRTMSHLVSPAPESYHVLNSAMSRMSSQRESSGDTGEAFNDVRALSRFLVKPEYTTELYCDADALKWRLIPRPDGELGVVTSCNNIQEDAPEELYHEYNTLELSRLALNLATTPDDPQLLQRVNEIVEQAQKRLALTMGVDLRGPTSSDASFNFALAGVHASGGLFDSLVYAGIRELRRTGHRSSFEPKIILRMIEKFAACDLGGDPVLELYQVAGNCLEKKGYSDAKLITALKSGQFGFHCARPLLWLWRHSSRLKKISIAEFTGKSTSRKKIIWGEVFVDTSKPIVCDIGCGKGASLLNLSGHASNTESRLSMTDDENHYLQLDWSQYNYAGAELNQASVNFGRGIISRHAAMQRTGRVHFFCLSAEEFLTELQSYPGGVQLIMINFPSPYRLDDDSGNSQLPLRDSNQFMVTTDALMLIADLLCSKTTSSDGVGIEPLFLFQTKCEDVAVHVKKLCLSLGTIESVPFPNPVDDIDHVYDKRGKKPKRVNEWLKCDPLSERAEGSSFSITPLLPPSCRPETEIQCMYENTVVHRCLFRRQTNELIRSTN